MKYHETLSNYRTIVKDLKIDINSINERHYNCGGFALGTFSCYAPYSLLEAMFNPSAIDKSIGAMVQWMLEEFPDLHIIKSVKELQPNEYAIAFRKSSIDFHFMRRMTDGTWAHKPGNTPIVKIDGRKVFSKEWPNGYNSEIYLFAKKIA